MDVLKLVDLPVQVVLENFARHRVFFVSADRKEQPVLKRVPLSELHPLRAPHEVLVWQKRMLLLIILLPSLLRLALTEKELLHAAHHFLGVFLGF